MSYSKKLSRNCSTPVSDTLSSLLLAIQSTDCGIILTDPQRDDNPIVFANVGFTKLTGYEVSEVIGRNCRFLQGTDTSQPQIKQIKEALELQNSVNVILRNYRKDGTLFWNELNISPVFDQNGELINFVGIQNDVTERMKSHTDKMAEDFMAILSHEVKVPMLGIQMILEKLTEPTLKNDPIHKYHDFLKSARQSNQSLVKLIDKLSSVYKPKGDSVEMEKFLSLKAIVDSCLNSFAPLIASKNLKVDLDELEDCQISKNGSKLAKVILALLSNAFRYTSENGLVTVKSKKLDNRLVIRISDNGPGLPEATKEKLFIGFNTRSSNDLLPVKVGVGLYSAHKLTNESGGNIRLTEGNGGEGSTFEIVWPT